MDIHSLPFKRSLIVFLCAFFLLVGGGLGSLITYNVIHNSEGNDQKIYLYDPTKNSKYSEIHVEDKPDDTFDKARNLVPGFTTQGTFSTTADVDLYTFTLDNPANVEITLRNVPKEYNVFIYDVNKVLIASSLRAGFLQSSSLIALSNPGKYYIKLLYKGGPSPTNTNFPYSILLTISPYTE